MSFTASRRRLRGRFGRTMILRRAGEADLAFRATMTAYRPESAQGDVRQGDAILALTNDEMAAAAWPAPPEARDQIEIDGQTWVVVGAWPVNSGETLIGWQIQIRGGQV